MEKLLTNITKWSMYLLIFLLPLFFLPFSFEAFEFNKQYLMFFLVSLGVFSWLTKMILVDKEIKFKRTPLDVFIIVFVILAIIGTIFSVDPSSSLFGFYGRFSNGLISLIILAIMYFFITNNVSVGEDKKGAKANIKISSLLNLFSASIFVTVISAFLSLFGLWGKINSLLPADISLPTVMLQRTFNPAAGSMEGLSVFLAIFLVYLIGRIINRSGGFFNYLLLFLITIFLILIDFTAVWIIIGLSLIVFLGIVLWKRIFKEDVNKLLLPMIFVILSVLFISINTVDVQSKLLGFQMPKEQVVSQRQTWVSTFGSATENIKSGVLGSGIGTYHYDFSKFKTEGFNESILWQIRFDRAGSHIAEILGTMGFLGILSYLALIGFFLMICYFFFQQIQRGIPLAMMFLALLVGQFFFYQNTVLAFTFWLILGLSVVNWQKPVNEKKVSFKDFPELSLIFSVVLIVLGLFIMTSYFFAGKFYMADINYKNAIGQERTKILEKAAGLNPYQAQYKIILARDYLNKIIVEGQRPADEQNQALLSDYVQKSIAYVKGGQLGGKIIKGAVEISPKRVAAWETLGMIYRDIQGLAQGASDWGIKSFQEAISLEPTNPVLRTELGKLYLSSDKREEAIDEFNTAKQLKPNYVDSSIQLALLYESENNLNQAIIEMENTESVVPLSTEVLFQLGRLYFNNNQVDDSISKLELVIIITPEHANAHYSLGTAYQKKGQISKAIAEFEKVLELNPDNTDVKSKINSLRGSTEE
ncbi:MAG: tetratricopeptide repeat protein [bacterium]